MDIRITQQLEDLTALVQALKHGIAAQSAEIERLQRRLDWAAIASPNLFGIVASPQMGYAAA